MKREVSKEVWSKVWEKGIEKVARALLAKNSDIAFIVDITGLSSVAVQKLQSSEELK